MNIKITNGIDKIDAIFKSLDKLKEKDVLVGIPSDNTGREDGEVNNAMIGYVHEHGSPAQNIPARPFLIPGIEDVQPFVETEQKKAIVAALDGKPNKIDSYLNRIGLKAVNSVKKRINSGDFAPLDEKTIKNRYRSRQTQSMRKAEKEFMKRVNAGEDSALVQADVGIKPLINTGQLRNAITYIVRSK